MNADESRDLAVLYRIAALTASDEDARTAERAVLAEIMSVIPADSGSLSLLNPHTGYLEIVTQQGLPPDTGDFALKLGQGVTGWVTLHGRPLLETVLQAWKNRVVFCGSPQGGSARAQALTRRLPVCD